KKEQLSIKQSRSDGVAAGKTVARPIHERAVNKRAMPMNKNLHPLVHQHSTRHSNDQSHEKRPPSLPYKKQHQRTQDDPDPFARTKLCKCVQHTHECRSETLM